MPFDYLEHDLTARFFSQVQDRFVESPRQVVEECRRALQASEAAFCAFQADEEAATRAFCECMTSFCEEIEALGAKLSSTTSLFRASDPQSYPVICAALRRAEERRRAWMRVLPGIEACEQASLACKSTVASAERMLSAALAAACGSEQYAQLAEIREQLARLEEECRALTVRTQCVRQARLDFCTARLSRFFGEVTEAADAAHDGHACDPARVRRLCGEICFAARQLT